MGPAHDWNTSVLLVIGLFVGAGALAVLFALLCYAFVDRSVDGPYARYWRELCEIADDAYNNGRYMALFGVVMLVAYWIVKLGLYIITKA
jgi:hypothetical protein